MALKKAKEIKKNFRAVVKLKKEKELDDSIFSNLCLVISTVCMHKSYNPIKLAQWVSLYLTLWAQVHRGKVNFFFFFYSVSHRCLIESQKLPWMLVHRKSCMLLQSYWVRISWDETRNLHLYKFLGWFLHTR